MKLAPIKHIVVSVASDNRLLIVVDVYGNVYM